MFAVVVVALLFLLIFSFLFVEIVEVNEGLL